MTTDTLDTMKLPRLYAMCEPCEEHRPEDCVYPVRYVAWSKKRMWICDECWDSTDGEWRHAVKADFFAETDQHD